MNLQNLWHTWRWTTVGLGIATLALLVASLGAPDKAAIAAEYPDKTVLALVPFGAGGGTDRWARVMSSVGFDIFDKGLRVQNRGGASGTIGWKHMLDRGADGHTLLFASPTPVMAALIEKNPPFDPTKIKIAAYYSVIKPTLMAPRGKPYASWSGFINHVKTSKKRLTVGGTMSTLLGPASALKQLGLSGRIIMVTYSGTGKAMNDYLGKHIDMISLTTSTAVTMMDKHVAIFNAADIDYPKKAKKILGDVPNSKTLGLKPFNPPRFIGMHPDTPDAQVRVMSERLGKMLSSKSVKKLIGKLGEVIVYLPHDEATKAYKEVLVTAKKNLAIFK